MKTKSLLTLLLVVAAPVFGSLQRGPVVPACHLPVIVDLNHDGLDDAVDGQNVFINSSGVLVPAAKPFPEFSNVIAAADVNGDGYIDVLANITAVGFRQTLFLGQAGLSFPFTYTVPSPWIALLLADIDGDGKSEIVLVRLNCDDMRSHCNTSTLSFVYALPDGSFERRGEMTFDTPETQPHAMAAGDLNNDGKTDLVVRLENDLLVFLGRGDGTFASPITRFLPMNAGLMPEMFLADIDGDGNIDLVGTEADVAVRVLFGDGRGGFSHVAKIETGGDGVISSGNIGLANYSTLSRMDIVAPTKTGDIVVISMKDGELAIVSRTPTDLRNLCLRGGAFHSPLRTDVYASEAISNGISQLFYSTETPSINSGQISRTSRGRAVLRAANHAMTLAVSERAECISTTEDWHFTREGPFAAGRTREDNIIEAFFDSDDFVNLRINDSYRGLLAPIGSGRYSGAVLMMTSCGVKPVWVDAQLK